MTILAQTLFAFVRGHLVALFLFTVRHSVKRLIVIISYLLFVYVFNEGLARLEAGQIVSSDIDSGVLQYVAGGLCSAVLDDEATEATQIYVFFLVQKAALHAFHKAFNHSGHIFLGHACFEGNLVDNVCFSHGSYVVFFAISAAKLLYFYGMPKFMRTFF